MFSALFRSAPRAKPADYAAQIRSGEALLIDVREAEEWAAGVLERATLLPISELRPPSAEWRSFLTQVGKRPVLVYCATGTRSGMAVRQLQSQGIQALNSGGLRDWTDAGWPVVKPIP